MIVLAIQEFYYEILEYSLLTFYLTAKKDKQIWICYNDECVSLSESVLKIMRVSNVNDLKRTIKAQFNISGNVTIHSRSETLEDNKLVTEVHNTKYNAYDIIVTENGIHNIGYFKTYILISNIFLTCHH